MKCVVGFASQQFVLASWTLPPGVALADIVEGADFAAYKMGSVQRSTSWLRRTLFINIFDLLKFLVQYNTFSDTELMMFIMSICSGIP